LQRIRDPLHNLIEFPADQFHDVMWRVIQTREFQRLRRVKQLGFSELVYPGATHSRFAHSLGVFHTARKLMKVVRDHLGDRAYQPSKANTALAAALVHDLGHGPYSHAFEDVGRRLKLTMADHEKVTDLLIREGEVSEAFRDLGSGFSSDVADVIRKSGSGSIYRAVVSSQFDADRLDYMQRDRLMTGTHHGMIDFDWLLSNLDVANVPYGVDGEIVGDVETFVLRPKALHAAEAYLLGLFQLYATVYLHKATRGAEKLFTELLSQLIQLAKNGSVAHTGLNDKHPLIRFAKHPEKLDNALALDDAVIAGALSMMTDAKDRLIRYFSVRLRDRKLFKCIDVRERLGQQLPRRGAGSNALNKACKAVEETLVEWSQQNSQEIPRILIDRPEREIYRMSEESKGPVDQIMMKSGNGSEPPVDVASVSQVIKAIEPFKALRVYFEVGDEKAKAAVAQAVDKEVDKCRQ
jgi:uncharacterized protein